MASHRQAVRQCARWQRTRVTTRSLPPTAAASHASARTSPAPSARSIVQNDKRTKSNGRTQHQGLFRQNCLGLALNGFALLPGLRVAVPDLPYLEEITHREFPRLAIVPLPLGRASISLPGVERVDGVVLPAERGSYHGRDAQPKQPRWSVIRNVLHWVK